MAARERPLGIYVHFPWCLKKCPYCDFLSLPASRTSIPHAAYAQALVRELGARRERLDGGYALRTVFFGGGTPSLWATPELGRVLEALLEAFEVSAEQVEVSVECNPTSLDLEKARALRDVGVNRLSIGVQGLDRERLQFLGRLHAPEEGLQAARAALASGVPRVSCDFIFGVAQQSPEAAATEARTLAALGSTHLSAYALTIEPGTEFGARAQKGRLPLLDDAAIADSFVAVSQTLEACGFEHYEISNYARDGHTAEHNLGYWRGRDYLGLGAGAWGTVHVSGERLRYRNTPSPERYMHSSFTAPFSAPGDTCAVVEPMDAETSLRERLLLGLRLAEGVDLDTAASELGASPWPAERRRAHDTLTRQGRIENAGGRLRIPKRHWLFADGITSALL